jgi:sugar/nucleoside kinase (ribokinase family)
VDVSKVIRDPALKTGITVSISSSKDRALVTFLGAIAELNEEDISETTLKEFDHVHVSSYFLQQRLRPGCHQLFARASRLGLTTSLDPGYDPSETWGQDLLQTLEETDLFFPNEVEALAIARSRTPEQALEVLANGRTLTVVKLGHAGLLRNAGRATVASTSLSRKAGGYDRRGRFIQCWILAHLAAQIELA